MIISLVVAYDLNLGIGWNGALPWRLPSDQKRFKKLTMGHHIVMGRKTWEAIGRPLPGRQSIIITHQSDFRAAEALVASSLAQAVRLAAQHGETECFVIGGGQIYAQALPFAGRVYATVVQSNGSADAFFPRLQPADWQETECRYIAEPGDQFAYYYKIIDRIKPPQEF